MYTGVSHRGLSPEPAPCPCNSQSQRIPSGPAAQVAPSPPTSIRGVLSPNYRPCEHSPREQLPTRSSRVPVRYRSPVPISYYIPPTNYSSIYTQVTMGDQHWRTDQAALVTRSYEHAYHTNCDRLWPGDQEWAPHAGYNNPSISAPPSSPPLPYNQLSLSNQQLMSSPLVRILGIISYTLQFCFTEVDT